MLSKIPGADSAFMRRVLHGVGANTYTQLVTILIQLGSVPLFLKVWNVETYGFWVLISAAPAYFAMADVGIMAVAINRITMLAGEDNWDQVRLVFNSCLLFLGIVVSIAAMIGACVAMFLDPNLLPGVAGWKWAASLLVLAALVSMSGGLFDAVFRAEGHFARGVYFMSTVRLIEWAGSMLGLVIGRSFLAVALCAFVARGLGMLAAFLYCRNNFPRFEWAPQRGSLREIRRMLASAVAFLAFPLGNAISIQGMTMLVAALLGPAGLAAFSALRTISRSVIQLVSTLSHALWPEFSRLYGAGDFVVLSKVFIRGAWTSGAVAVASGVAMLLLTPFVLKVWTHGKVQFDFMTTALFVLATVLGGLWHVPRTLLLSTNSHISISIHYLCASVALLSLGWAGFSLLGEMGLLMALSVFEAYMIFVCMICVGAVLSGNANNNRVA